MNKVKSSLIIYDNDDCITNYKSNQGRKILKKYKNFLKNLHMKT
jgi:hypothetical protein